MLQWSLRQTGGLIAVAKSDQLSYYEFEVATQTWDDDDHQYIQIYICINDCYT